MKTYSLENLTENEAVGLLTAIDSLLAGWAAGVVPRTLFMRMLSPEAREMLFPIGLSAIEEFGRDEGFAEKLIEMLGDETRRLGLERKLEKKIRRATR